MPLFPRRRPNLQLNLTREKPAGTPTVEQKYEFHEPLGHGSVATVRRATLRGDPNHRQVAIKTIRSHDPEMIIVAERECDLLMSMCHPNIIQVQECIVDRAICRADIVMPLIIGSRLDLLIRRDGTLTENDARPLFVQLLSATHHCHAHRICHRDIKPENIMIAEDASTRTLVLMDFNAACKGQVLTPTGTRPYMSPEAWHAHALYNEMTDLWSAGVCLYFMIAGYLPWVGERMHVMALEVSSFPIRMPAGLSAEALSLLNGLLCRNVASRLMVTGALAHPWCQLAEEEVQKILGLQSAGEHSLPQPSYRDWEVKARKEDLSNDDAAMRKNFHSWPMFPLDDGPPLTFESYAHAASYESTVGPAKASQPQWYSCVHQGDGRSQSLQSTSPWARNNVLDLSQTRWYVNLSAANSSSSSVVPNFWGWESRMRQTHLQELYGSPALHRNWQTFNDLREACGS